MKEVYISAPRYRHGELRSISDIDELKSNDDLLETLFALGLNTYAAANIKELFRMSAEVVGEVLAQNNLNANDIDAIIYPSTCYFMGSNTNNPDLPTSLIEHVVDTLGMPKAIPYGVSFSRCVNSINAIEFARGLIASGAANNVLVLVADSMQKGFSRIVDPGISVVSDVAACLLVTSDVKSIPSFKIGVIKNHVDWELSKITPQDDFPDYLRRTVKGMEVVKDNVLSETSTANDDYIQLITNTVNDSVVRIFSQATGFKTEDIYSKNVIKLGHCDGADILVNLCDYSEILKDQSCSSGSLLIIANGPFMWGGMSLSIINRKADKNI